MSHRVSSLLVGVLLLGGTLCMAQGAPDLTPNDGIALGLCIGINKYTLMDDRQFGREDAQALAKALKSGGFQTVEVLVDATRPENQATLGNIRSFIKQLTLLARPQDGLLIFFSGHAVTTGGKPHLVSMHGDEDVALPFEWVREAMAQSKAGGKLLVLDVGKGAASIAQALTGVPDHKGLAVLLSSTGDEPPQVDRNAGHSVFAQALLEGLGGKADRNKDKWVSREEILTWLKQSMKNQTPQMLGTTPGKQPVARVTGTAKPSAIKRGHGLVRFVMHRKMVMNVKGTSREVWRLDGTPIEFTWRFNRDTHKVVYTTEIPAGEYDGAQLKWEHKTSAGNFKGGPYKPLPRRIRVEAGKEHELKQFNHQDPLSPHGTGLLFWDGDRLMLIHSNTKKRWIGPEIDREYAKKPEVHKVRTPLAIGRAQRPAKLYAMAGDQFRKALLEARQIELRNGLVGNRVLIAEAANELARLYATAQDEKFRNGRKALGLAREAVGLAREMKMEKPWVYKDTLAAALAENGQFDEAAKTMSEAITEAKETKPVPPPPYEMAKFEARLKLYQSKQPYRE